MLALLLLLVLGVVAFRMAASIRGNRHARRTGAVMGPSGADKFRGVFVQERGPANGIPVVLFTGNGGMERTVAAHDARGGRGRLPRHRARPAAVRVLRSPGQLQRGRPGRAHQRRAHPSEGRARHHRRPFLWAPVLRPSSRCDTRTAHGPLVLVDAGAGTDGSALGRAMDYPAEMDSRSAGIADHHQSGGDQDAARVPDCEERTCAARIRRHPAKATTLRDSTPDIADWLYYFLGADRSAVSADRTTYARAKLPSRCCGATRIRSPRPTRPPICDAVAASHADPAAGTRAHPANRGSRLV